MLGLKVLNNIILLGVSSKWIENDKKAALLEQRIMQKRRGSLSQEEMPRVYDLMQSETSRMLSSKKAAKKVKKKNLLNNGVRFNRFSISCLNSQKNMKNLNRSEE